MATWAIGDVHGCWRTLEALIDRIRLDETRDRLWLVGDLVNRGPESLEVLRWARELHGRMGDRFQVVLGNHDLHLIARALGVATARRRDTLDAVLTAEDGADLVAWLRRRPFLHIEDIGATTYVLVHAGLPPGCSSADALEAGKRLERHLQGPAPAVLLKQPPPAQQNACATGSRRRALPSTRDRNALAAFTRVRMLDRHAQPHDYNGPPGQAPANLRPWFAVEPRGCSGHTVVCGHWAALGLHLLSDLIALDTGCAWGRRLSAVRLDDRSVTQQPAID